MRKPLPLSISSHASLLRGATFYRTNNAGLLSGDPLFVPAGITVEVLDLTADRALLRVLRDGRFAFGWVELSRVTSRDALPLFA